MFEFDFLKVSALGVAKQKSYTLPSNGFTRHNNFDLLGAKHNLLVNVKHRCFWLDMPSPIALLYFSRLAGGRSLRANVDLHDS